MWKRERSWKNFQQSNLNPALQSQTNPRYPSKLGEMSGASAAVLNRSGRTVRIQSDRLKGRCALLKNNDGMFFIGVVFCARWGHQPAFKISTAQPLPYPDVLPIRSYSSVSEVEREAIQSRQACLATSIQEIFVTVFLGDVLKVGAAECPRARMISSLSRKGTSQEKR